MIDFNKIEKMLSKYYTSPQIMLKEIDEDTIIHLDKKEKLKIKDIRLKKERKHYRGIPDAVLEKMIFLHYYDHYNFFEKPIDLKEQLDLIRIVPVTANIRHKNYYRHLFRFDCLKNEFCFVVYLKSPFRNFIKYITEEEMHQLNKLTDDVYTLVKNNLVRDLRLQCGNQNNIQMVYDKNQDVASSIFLFSDIMDEILRKKGLDQIIYQVPNLYSILFMEHNEYLRHPEKLLKCPNLLSTHVFSYKTGEGSLIYY